MPPLEPIVQEFTVDVSPVIKFARIVARYMSAMADELEQITKPSTDGKAQS